MKVLLWIEDDQALIDRARPVFKAHGFLLLAAQDGAEAASLLEQQPVDGVLVDVRLARGEDGLQLIERFHAQFPSLPFVVFTGYPDYGDALTALDTGAKVYWPKVNKSIPLDPEKRRRFFDTLHQIFPGRTTARREFQWRWLVGLALGVLGVAAIFLLPVLLSWTSLLRHDHRLGIQLTASALVLGIAWIIADHDPARRRVAFVAVVIAGFFTIAEII